MAFSTLSDDCAGMDAEFIFGPVKIEPDHDACPVSDTRHHICGTVYAWWVSQCRNEHPVEKDRSSSGGTL